MWLAFSYTQLWGNLLCCILGDFLCEKQEGGAHADGHSSRVRVVALAGVAATQETQVVPSLQSPIAPRRGLPVTFTITACFRPSASPIEIGQQGAWRLLSFTPCMFRQWFQTSQRAPCPGTQGAPADECFSCQSWLQPKVHFIFIFQHFLSHRFFSSDNCFSVSVKVK